MFGVNFPSEPKVQDIAYTTEFGIALPAHLYSADSGASHYSVTVVDYADAEKIHAARAAQCKKDGGESDACTNDFRGDVQGSIVNASWRFIQTEYESHLLRLGGDRQCRRTTAATCEP